MMPSETPLIVPIDMSSYKGITRGPSQAPAPLYTIANSTGPRWGWLPEFAVIPRHGEEHVGEGWRLRAFEAAQRLVLRHHDDENGASISSWRSNVRVMRRAR